MLGALLQFWENSMFKPFIDGFPRKIIHGDLLEDYSMKVAGFSFFHVQVIDLFVLLFWVCTFMPPS